MFFLVVSILDINSNALSGVRFYISNFTGVLQYLVDYPVKKISYLSASISSYNNILAHNIKLQQENIYLKTEAQQLVSLRKKNSELWKLFHAKKQLSKTDNTIVEIMAIENNSLYVINKGNEHGVILGQILVDTDGVFGQITRVNAKTSIVSQISDPQIAISGQNARTGARAIIRGKNQNSNLALLNVPMNADIKVGDLYFTSGLSLACPYGYPIGVVTNINNNTGDGFMDVTLNAQAQLNKSSILLLLNKAQRTKNDIL